MPFVLPARMCHSVAPLCLCAALLGGLSVLAEARPLLAQEASARIPGPLDGRILSVTSEGQTTPLQISAQAILAGPVRTGLSRVGILSGPDGPLKPAALYAIKGALPEGFATCTDGPAAFLALRRDKGSTALTGLVFEARPILAMARGEGLCGRITLNAPLPPDLSRAEPDPVDVAMVETMAVLTPVSNIVEDSGTSAPDPALKAGQVSHGLLAELDPYRQKLSTVRQDGLPDDQPADKVAALAPLAQAPLPAAMPQGRTDTAGAPVPLDDMTGTPAQAPRTDPAPPLDTISAAEPVAAPAPAGPASATSARGDASTSDEEAPETGAWRVIEARDARNLPQVALVLKASQTTGANGQPAQLVARCMGNQTALFAVWPQGFSGDARAEFLTKRDVTLQIDGARPERQPWELWPTQDATYAPGFPGDLLRRLQRAEQLTLRTANLAGHPLEARFDLTGLAEHLPVLATPCRWTP